MPSSKSNASLIRVEDSGDWKLREWWFPPISSSDSSNRMNFMAIPDKQTVILPKKYSSCDRAAEDLLIRDLKASCWEQGCELSTHERTGQTGGRSLTFRLRMRCANHTKKRGGCRFQFTLLWNIEKQQWSYTANHTKLQHSSSCLPFVTGAVSVAPTICTPARSRPKVDKTKARSLASQRAFLEIQSTEAKSRKRPAACIPRKDDAGIRRCFDLKRSSKTTLDPSALAKQLHSQSKKKRMDDPSGDEATASCMKSMDFLSAPSISLDSAAAAAKSTKQDPSKGDDCHRITLSLLAEQHLLASFRTSQPSSVLQSTHESSFERIFPDDLSLCLQQEYAQQALLEDAQATSVPPSSSLTTPVVMDTTMEALPPMNEIMARFEGESDDSEVQEWLSPSDNNNYSSTSSGANDLVSSIQDNPQLVAESEARSQAEQLLARDEPSSLPFLWDMDLPWSAPSA